MEITLFFCGEPRVPNLSLILLIRADLLVLCGSAETRFRTINNKVKTETESINGSQRLNVKYYLITSSPESGTELTELLLHIYRGTSYLLF